MSGLNDGGGQLVDKVIRWELKGNRVLLLDVNFGLVADPKAPIAMAVKAAKEAGLANTAHIEGGIDAWKKAGGPVVQG